METWKRFTRIGLLAGLVLSATALWMLPQADAGINMSSDEWIITEYSASQREAKCSGNEDCYELCEVLHSSPEVIVPTGHTECF